MPGERKEGTPSAPSALEAIRARALAAARKPAEIMTSVAEANVSTSRDRRSRAKQVKEGFEAPRHSAARPVSLMEVESLLQWVDFGIESSKHVGPRGRQRFI